MILASLPVSLRRIGPVDWAVSPVGHQLLAMAVGGIAAFIAIIGLTVLLHRRLADPRIRLNSCKWDIVVAIMLRLQLALGFLTVPLSAFHMDRVLFETLTSYVKGIVTLDGIASSLIMGVPLVYKLPRSMQCGTESLSASRPASKCELCGSTSRSLQVRQISLVELAGAHIPLVQ